MATEKIFTVSSVGVNGDGKPVIRIIVLGMTTIVSTDIVGLATLAARGVPVVNDAGGPARK